MSSLSLTNLALKRLASDWMLLVSVFVGIFIATTLVAAAPVYLQALERLALNLAIDQLPRPFSNINPAMFDIPLTAAELDRTDRSMADAIERQISPIDESRERYLIVDTYLAGTPRQPLPRPGTGGPRPGRAYFRYFSNLEHHVTLSEGVMADDKVTMGPRGPVAQAVVSRVTADRFGLKIDDVVEATPDLGAVTQVSAKIVGIVKAPSPREDYWRYDASIILDPPPIEEESTETAEADYDPSQPPIPLFLTREAMVEAVGKAHPGTLIDSLWFIFVDTERLKDWSFSETRRRLDDFELELSEDTPGTEVFTGINPMLDTFERRSFFSRVPLLLLLAVMVLAVLFFLAMMASYLVESRASDVALFRTRGVGTLQLLRIYAVEGLMMTIAAVILAPFAAMGIVALVGKVPYFHAMTGGSLLPVELELLPFVAAAGAGVLCLIIFVLPGALGTRGGVLVHRLRSSRPPTTPFVHRYYIDVGLLTLGGLAFWELRSRGQLISGGLFEDVEVNETLLLAPFLFFIVVALVFMRAFPLLVRFVSGESSALLHLVTAAAVLILAPAIAIREIQDDNGLAWLYPVALLLAAGGAYWATDRTAARNLRIAGLLLQTALIALFLRQEPPDGGSALFVPTVGLIAIVPAQLAFLLLKRSMRAAPVWLSMSLWRMARNPLEFTWLILLLVLVTGVGVLSTTVGGTLVQSQEERVLYEVATDIRISDVSRRLGGGVERLQQTYEAVPGVNQASPAYRETGTAGATNVEVLGIESREFQYISWYRDDFSARPLGDLMKSLTSHPHVDRLEIPEEATEIGVWAMPADVYPNVSLYMMVQNDAGRVSTLSLGQLGEPEWNLMTAEIPTGLQRPLYLVSVQLFEPGFGAVATPGAIFLDDIHVTNGPDGDAQTLEGFEGQINWIPIVTSGLASDFIASTERDSYEGARAGVVTFGKETVRGIRGVYRSPTGGPVPVVVSEAFAAASDTNIGHTFIVDIVGKPVPAVIRDIVSHFPTMSAIDGSFLVADLDNLLAHMNIMGVSSPARSNELFLTEVPAAHESVLAAVTSSGREGGRVRDKLGQLESVRLDPLTTAGWRSLVILSLGIVLLAAGLGYVTYLLSFANRSKGEIGFLQSLGVSRRQLMGLLGFEHLAIVLIGLGLGTWAGFQASRLMVSSVAVTETGDRVVPPFILVTDWSLMLPTYAALLGIFLASQYLLNRSIRSLDLTAISRVQGV